MKKNFRAQAVSKVLPALLLWTALAFARKDSDPFAQTESAITLAAKVTYYLVGMIAALMALGPIVLASIMGYKSYQQAKETREGNPATAGVKTFALWIIIAGLMSLFAYYFMNIILDGKLGQVIGRILTIEGGAE